MQGPHVQRASAATGGTMGNVSELSVTLGMNSSLKVLAGGVSDFQGRIEEAQNL